MSETTAVGSVPVEAAAPEVAPAAPKRRGRKPGSKNSKRTAKKGRAVRTKAERLASLYVRRKAAYLKACEKAFDAAVLAAMENPNSPAPEVAEAAPAHVAPVAAEPVAAQPIVN